MPVTESTLHNKKNTQCDPQCKPYPSKQLLIFDLTKVYCVRHQLYTKRGLGAYYEPQSDDEIPEYSIAMLSELFDLLQKFPYQTAEVDGVKVRY